MCRKWTEGQGTELSNTPISIYALVYGALYVVGIMVPFMGLCVVFVSPRGRIIT